MSFGAVLRVVGGVLVFAGLVLSRVLKSSEAARRRGLDRRLKLSPSEQFSLMGRNPRVFIPLNLIVSGVLLVVASFVMVIARLL